MSELPQRLPSTLHVARQPVLALGLNGTEFLALLFTGFTAMLVFTLIGLLLFPFYFAFLFGFGTAFLLTFVLQQLLKYHKRQKPEGYYQQRLQRLGREWFGNEKLVSHRGQWDTLRHRED